MVICVVAEMGSRHEKTCSCQNCEVNDSMMIVRISIVFDNDTAKVYIRGLG